MSIDLSNMKVVSGSVQGTRANEEISNGDVIARVVTGASKAINTDESKKAVLGIAINNAPEGGLVFYLGTGAVIEDDNIANSGYDVTYWLGSTAGKLEEYDDIALGEWAVLIGDAYQLKRQIRLSIVDYDIQKQSELPVDANPPEAVGSLSIGTVTTNSVGLSWNYPSSTSQPVTSYNVQYKLDSEGLYRTAAGVGLSNTTTVTGLVPDSTYTFRVRANSSNGAGEWSSVDQKTVDVNPPGPVTSLQIDNATSLAVSLSWDSPDTSTKPVTSYTLEYKKTDEPTYIPFELDSALSESATVTGLSASSDYTFRVRATSANGDGDWSSIETSTVR